MSARAGICAALVLAWAGVAGACGPYYPNGYLYQGHECGVLQMPLASFHSALEVAAGHEVERDEHRNRKSAGTRRRDAEREDLRAALTNQGIDAKAIEDIWSQYEHLRAYISRIASSRPNYHEDGRQAFYSPALWGWKEGEANNGWPGQWYRDHGEPGSVPPSLNMRLYNDLLIRLPSEFTLYVLGAALYKTGKYEDAIWWWKRLLELPAEQRRYRSTWAAFMIGKAYLQLDPEIALIYFAKTQALADEGFQDTLRLAPSSLGWMGFVEGRTGRMVDAFHHYFEMWVTSQEPDQTIGRTSLDFWASRVIRDGEVDDALVQDELCANILMAHIVTSSYRHSSISPLATRLAENNGALLEKWAGRIAWKEYRQGRFDSAAEWVERAAPECPYGKWTHAKLFMREGDIGDAVELLRELLPAFPVADYVGDDYRIPESKSGNMVHADLGMLLVSREEYVAAMELFMAGHYWPDAAYLAERVLTLDEVEFFISQHESDPRFAQMDPAEFYRYDVGAKTPLKWLEYLYGRRLIRAGRVEEAIPFLREEVSTWTASGKVDIKLPEEARKYASHLKRGRDTARSRKERAENLMVAGRVVRTCGLEIMGTETEPDWVYFQGSYEIPGATVYRFKPDRGLPYGCPEALWDHLQPTDSERRRVERHKVEPEKRFHYRYVAADLMWEASKLLPDNDPMTARALYEAGTWIMNRDPEAADKYYKALVRRCGRLPIGRKADELRWFPREVTDEDFEMPGESEA